MQEFGDPLGSEFRTVLEQTRIGLPLPRALEDMLKRVPEDDLRLLVVAVKVQTEVGSSLAAIVGRLAEIVRMRQRLRLQIRSLDRAIADGRHDRRCAADCGAGRLQPGPAGLRGALFTDPTGLKILKTAIVLDVLAFITIRRLLKLRY